MGSAPWSTSNERDRHSRRYCTALFTTMDPTLRGDDTPQPPTPTERALTLPEILSHIFLCTLTDLGIIAKQTAWDLVAHRRSLAALARCCRVSKLWYAEALPHLWSRPCSTRLDSQLWEVLAHVAPGPRRQYHADLVEENVTTCRWGQDRLGAEAVLRGLKFPRLRRVAVLLGSLVPIPEFDGGSVTRLDLLPTARRDQYDPDNPDDQSYLLDQRLVLNQIPVSVLVNQRAVLVGALLLMRSLYTGIVPQPRGCGIPRPMFGIHRGPAAPARSFAALGALQPRSGRTGDCVTCHR